jgi:hypothetical protein
MHVEARPFITGFLARLIQYGQHPGLEMKRWLIQQAMGVVCSIQWSHSIVGVAYTLVGHAFFSFSDRIRSTLVHEMCHAATWLVDGVRNGGHGPVWTAWLVLYFEPHSMISAVL